MTRTVVLGRASQRQRDLHELVRGAQAAGLACLQAGVAGGELSADEALRRAPFPREDARTALARAVVSS